MFKRLLILARDFNQAQHWAKDKRLSLGSWVYVSSFYNIQGNPEHTYVTLPNWKSRPDSLQLNNYLEKYNCVPDERFEQFSS